MDEMAVDENNVAKMCLNGDYAECLTYLISFTHQKDYPKYNIFHYIYKLMIAIKKNDIPTIVDRLSAEDAEILLKYVYKGFEFPRDGSSNILLNWHEYITDKFGLGAIMRVLTDRRWLTHSNNTINDEQE